MQFAREIDQTTTIFEENKHAPPVTKNQPPIAGAIKWARALLARLKQTMIKLHSTEEEIIRTTGAQLQLSGAPLHLQKSGRLHSCMNTMQSG